ncbi:MAG: nucleotidyltransferase [Bacteroidetes bacterium]|nr:MAG: nucleotidyltransferase [Bacteroidota bacterium]TAG85982.1 MAG: nucleotidyltransferase [Bacteroidota bacterium]
MEQIIFKAIVGSQSYGTNIATSDIDYKGVYMQNEDDLLTFGYKEQIDVSKDECYYEARRFLQLLQSANPTVLELLYSPADCIIDKKPVFDLIMAYRDKFLTKKCVHSFGGYAIAQIKKAKGLDKKMNWEKERIVRKNPLDFVYVYENGKTILVEKWLENNHLLQEFCGLVSLEHFKDGYALYYDSDKNLGFKGISLENSNNIRLSSIPKNMNALAIVNFNKDGYSKHCKDYNQYQEWLNNRNTQRYVDTTAHEQKIDGKNLMHCRRLLDMAIEIATEKTIKVRRPNAKELLEIRKGNISLEKIIENAEIDIQKLENLFENSDLPNEISLSFVNDLLLEMRYFFKKSL